MSLTRASGITLIIVALFLIYKINTDQVGGALKQMDISNRYQDPYYARQYRELDDVDNVLNRPIEKGNEEINTLKPTDLKDLDAENRGNKEKMVKTHFHFLDIKPKEVSESTKVLVESKQPYFLDEALIQNYYGDNFYWDWRYPKQPISVEFAKDPERYVRMHPKQYPSYIISSRDYSNLRPHDKGAEIYCK